MSGLNQMDSVGRVWLWWVGLLIASPGCSLESIGGRGINPFRDLAAVPKDGLAHVLATNVAPLGMFEGGEVLRVLVTGGGIETVSILIEDDVFAEAGVIVGGGRPNEAFDYRVPVGGRYFVFVEFASGAQGDALRGTITLSDGDASFVPPPRQAVVLDFDSDFLTGPGLFDPESGTGEERAFLEDISEQVAADIFSRVRTIFEGTPIAIFEAGDAPVGEAFSRVRISPRREPADEATLAIDSTGDDTACGDRVIFGEVLPRGSPADRGNLVLDDRAIVYVGSFQGRGAACRTASINSINNIVLGLSQTAAHEIGHLVGLQHVALVDIMDRSPSRAFQRELTLGRGQVLTEGPRPTQTSAGDNVRNALDGDASPATTVQTTIIQDPEKYFDSVFGVRR